MTNEEIVTAIQTGSGERRQLLEQLYTQNARMIEKIIRRYKDVEELDDLRQEAFISIVEAAESWKGGGLFIYYAAQLITHSVARYRRENMLVRFPRRQCRMIFRYLSMMKEGRTDSEICAALDVTPEKLKTIRQETKLLNLRSISEQTGDEGGTLENTIADDRDAIGDALNTMQHEQLAAALWSEVDQLEPRHGAVIRERYQEGRTPTECADVIGITPGAVRRLESKALRELGRGDRGQRLRPYWTESEAYSAGIRNTGVKAFRRIGSSQERAVMLLEQLLERNLQGVKYNAESENAKEG